MMSVSAIICDRTGISVVETVYESEVSTTSLSKSGFGVT